MNVSFVFKSCRGLSAKNPRWSCFKGTEGLQCKGTPVKTRVHWAKVDNGRTRNNWGGGESLHVSEGRAEFDIFYKIIPRHLPQSASALSGSASDTHGMVISKSPRAGATFVPQHFGTMGSFDTLMSQLRKLHPSIKRETIVEALIELRAQHRGHLIGLPLRKIRELASELLTRSETDANAWAGNRCVMFMASSFFFFFVPQKVCKIVFKISNHRSITKK